MILSASGGLVYHARAAFTRIESLISGSGEDRWAPTRRCVSSVVGHWLAELQTDTLIIFGPSAGYLLEPNFFANFSSKNESAPLKIIAVDPDPLAAVLFRHRFPQSAIEWHTRHDLLPFSSPRANALTDFLELACRNSTRPAVLFLGLLGQVALHRDSATRSQHEARHLLKVQLARFNWASLHDLESTTLERKLLRLPAGMRPESFADVAALESLKSTEARAEFSAKRLLALAAPAKGWIDHETNWLGPPEVVIPWLLTPRRFHHLGFIKTSIVVTG